MKHKFSGINDETKSLINQRTPRWYHRYDNYEVLNIAYDTYKHFWEDIDHLDYYYINYPESGVPTLQEKGITEEALDTYIQNKCQLVALAKSKDVDLSGDKINKELRFAIGCYNEDIPVLLILIAVLGLVIAVIWAIIVGDVLFGRTIFYDILFFIIGWFSSSVLLVLLFVVMEELGTPLINFIREYRYNRAIITMESLDSTMIRVNEIKRQQRAKTIEYDRMKFCRIQEDKEPEQTEPIVEPIKDSWSLIDFVRIKGKMQVGTFNNKETGDTFKSCIFTNGDGYRTFVGFSKKLGELTPSEIVTQKDNLIVILNEDGHYVLCRKEP